MHLVLFNMSEISSRAVKRIFPLRHVSRQEDRIKVGFDVSGIKLHFVIRPRFQELWVFFKKTCSMSLRFNTLGFSISIIPLHCFIFSL